MNHGAEIGRKFAANGEVLRYPGNTVVADLPMESKACKTLCALRNMLAKSTVAEHYILLPEDSYHMTVIRGLNDAVRNALFWPAALALTASLREMDAYVAQAMLSIPMPRRLRMRFETVRADETDLRVRLRAADEAQQAELRNYRNQVADALGLRLPEHDAYTYHITLAYTRLIPTGRDAAAVKTLEADMNRLLALEPAFEMAAPYIAFYENMLHFSNRREEGVQR